MKDKLLLHSCCAPCSSAIVESLHNYYNITLYYYNPCITSEKEYFKRADELYKLSDYADIVIADFEPDAYFDYVKGFENHKEGGGRCTRCFIQRLLGTAKYAKENEFNYFSTTLTISPYKDSAVINAAGKICGWDYDVMYMPFDFKYLYVRSLELCEQYGLYQQDYCGCVFSKNTNS